MYPYKQWKFFLKSFNYTITSASPNVSLMFMAMRNKNKLIFDQLKKKTAPLINLAIRNR
jgi:hypothetical protein